MKDNVAAFRKYVEEGPYEYLDRSWVLWMLDNLVYCEEKGIIINPNWLRADPLGGSDNGTIRGINADNI